MSPLTRCATLFDIHLRRHYREGYEVKELDGGNLRLEEGWGDGRRAGSIN